MDNIPTCRAAYLIPFIEVLRDIGVPVTRDLEKARLPVMVEETPDEIINSFLGMEFLAGSARREGLDDLSWHWVQNFSASDFSAELTLAMQPLPTVKARLNCLSELIALEDSSVQVGISRVNGSAEIYCDAASSSVSNDPISEWTQVSVLIETIRSIAGAEWSPDEIRFQADFSVCDAAREANPNTRFLSRSSHTSIIVPSSVFATTKLNYGTTQAPSLVSRETGRDGNHETSDPPLPA